MLRRRVVLEIPWRTLLKLIAAVALVWLCLKLSQLILLLIVAILLAVALDPVVEFLERRRLSRTTAATLVCGVLFAVLIAFVYFAGASLANQAHLIGTRLHAVEQQALESAPPALVNSFGTSAHDLQTALGRYALTGVESLAEAAVVVVLAGIVTLYLLIEGCRTCQWVLAFFPPTQRRKVDATARECRRVMIGYVAGNIATSIFATTFVFVSLTILKVPAALLLALLAGVFDFVPVLGFIASAVPAILLALTVSATTAIIVIVLYIAYHLAENYFIGPWVYGDRLKLSDLAVVLAFAVGAALGGVVGAAIALPIAAAYPAVESIWLKERLGEEVVAEHRAIERKKAG